MSIQLPYRGLIDLRYEMSLLEKQLDLIREQVEHQARASQFVTNQKIDAMELDPDDPSDAADYTILTDEHRHLVNDVLPRVLINPFAVSVWSLYESAMRDLAKLIEEKEEATLSFSDISGKHLPDRTEKYFTHVLDFPVQHTSGLRKKLGRLKAFRNAIAHQNGRLAGLKKSLQSSVRKGDIDGVGLARLGNYFILRVSFAERAFETVRGHLLDLFDEYRSRY